MDTNDNAIVEKIVNSILAMEAGTLIAHDVMENLLGISKKNNKYYRFIIAAKKRLEREHNTFLRTIPKKGYTIAVPGVEQAEICEGTVLQGVKKIYRGVARFNNIDLNKIENETEKVTVIDIANKRKNLLTLLKASGETMFNR